MNIQELERAAIEAHRAGLLWPDFVAEHGERLGAACRGDRSVQRRLTAKLLALVVSGDTGGLYPLDDGWARPMEHELAELA